MKKKLSHEQMSGQNWRYKKKTVPVDEFADKNGAVKITVPKIPTDLPPKLGTALHADNIVDGATQKHLSHLPNPFKCSKCEYVATGKADFNDHWTLEH